VEAAAIRSRFAPNSLLVRERSSPGQELRSHGRRGRCRGIGVAMSIELNTGAPRERAELTIDPSGTVELVLGTISAGQGHETSFAQVNPDALNPSCVSPCRRVVF
jgi:CO/xanthine dehydrogenase Mo-binding subunit